ncbi:MAG TPA: condensation domain-containing protein, partial [Actinomycetota bacterium]|nr:condensation domain-containing protein [Actinomycetota bacterium]
WMLPAQVVLLDRLPLTPNGKVDHRALPQPQSTREVLDTTYQAPRTPLERLLADIWTQVLGLDRVGIHDNFFHLGGDSIRSVQVAGQARQRGWELRLDALFAHPTIAGVARHLRRVQPEPDRARRSQPFELLGEQDRRKLPPDMVDAYPMAAMQLSMLYHMELDPEGRPYHNVNSYRIAAPLDEALFARAVADATARHPVLRTSFDLVTYSEPMQLVHRGARLPVAFHDLRDRTEEERQATIAALVEHERRAPFPLDDPPLLRIHVHRLSEEQFQLTLAEHHAILDGWSFTGLLAEILERHARLRGDPDLPAPEPPASSFRDFVALERLAASSTSSLRYWRHKLRSADGALLAAADFTPGAGVVTLERELPRELCGRLRDFAGALGVGLKTVALAAHVIALGGLAATDRVTTGLAVNGRLEEAAGTDVRGLFLNTLPLQVALPGGGWTTLVRRLHAEETEMLPHRRVPFSLIAPFMEKPGLDTLFFFNRFHALGRLREHGVKIVDDRIGSEPTLRREPTHFMLSAGLVQDPVSGRVLLAMDFAPPAVTRQRASRFAARCVAALDTMTRDPQADYRDHLEPL